MKPFALTLRLRALLLLIFAALAAGLFYAPRHRATTQDAPQAAAAGDLDLPFAPNLLRSGAVNSLAVQADGKTRNN